VRRLNADPAVDGILVQLPLPAHMDERVILSAIDLGKDADGLHPLNVGALALKGHTPRAIACTPKGCLELLRRSGVALEGKRAVVLGRSNIVGIPAALLLLAENATVTVCHSRTANLPDVVREVRRGRARAPSVARARRALTAAAARATRQADVLIAAIGKPAFVKGDWLKDGAVVIDVGINSVPDAGAPRGYRLVGDCDFESCAPRASLITPVPGGVGPLTIAMLLQNTFELYVAHLGSGTHSNDAGKL
jgi:5,10-methylene-tetrahydrofolate dehydrogenase/methenyl tetrahydrofolate cyclohydrolase